MATRSSAYEAATHLEVDSYPTGGIRMDVMRCQRGGCYRAYCTSVFCYFFAVLTWYVVGLVFMFPLKSVALEAADRLVKTSFGKIFNYPLASNQHRTARYEEGL